MEKLEIGLLYLSLHNQLKKRVGVGKVLTVKKFYEILGKHFLIPKNLRLIMIYEMEEKELIKRDGKDFIKILSCNLDIERDGTKFYKKVGLI